MTKNTAIGNKKILICRLVSVPNVIFEEHLIENFSEIALCLKISRISQPNKNPVNLQGELGDS